MSKRRNKQKESFQIEKIHPWKVSKGHQEHMSGAGSMGDRRMKRRKTRQSQRKDWQND